MKWFGSWKKTPWSGQAYSLHKKWGESDFSLILNFQRSPIMLLLLAVLWFASSFSLFTSPQMRRERKNWRICGGDSLLHTDAGVACRARLLNCSVVVFLACSVWVLENKLWNASILISLRRPSCFLLSFSRRPHGLLTLWWPLRSLGWQLCFPALSTERINP